jgi:exportin-5
MLQNKTPHFSGVVEDAIGELLQLCSERCIRYDVLPANSGNPALEYLAVDCDNIPQRDAVLSQYRANLLHVIEQIVRKLPLDAIKHILAEASKFFHGVASEPFSPAEYFKVSPTSMTADAHFATIECALRGFQRWQATHIDANPDAHKSVEQQGNDLRLLLSQWCQTSLAMPIQDPDIKRKLVTQAVTITCKVTPLNNEVAFTILDSLLSSQRESPTGSPQYQEAVKELFEMSAHSAQRLASVFADAFLGIYEQLEARVETIARQDEELRPKYFAFLLMIIHRASNLDTETRTERLRRMISPVRTAWQDPDLIAALESYETFCNSVGWSRLPEFLAASNFHLLKDWSAQQLTKEGLEFQTYLLARNDATPVRLTKALLNATTEKLEEGSTAFAIAKTVWAEILPSILPNLFKMLSYATLFQNPARWPAMPAEIKAAMVRLLQDRFWQSGISNESRDAFVARISNSKNSYDGLGSSVRKTLRQIRSGSCDIILLLAKLGGTFYGIADMAQPLSQAVYDDSEALSSHHFNALIHFSNNLIGGCPVHLRHEFLPPVISSLFQRLRFKVDFEWAADNQHTEQATADDDLDDEMKNQSILRTMTFAACNLLWGLVSRRGKHAKTLTTRTDGPEPDKNAVGESEYTVFQLILTDAAVLEQVLLFATSASRTLRARAPCTTSCATTCCAPPSRACTSPTSSSCRRTSPR